MSNPPETASVPKDEVSLSTRDVAQWLGVSEATVKRWSDDGLITCRRTPGGHRKFVREDVHTFMRKHHFADPSEVPPPPVLTPDEVIRVALKGDARALLRTLRGALDRGLALPELLDLHVAPALFEVGERWACAGLNVAEEHLVSTTITEVLGRLSDALAHDDVRGVAVASCLSGEHHAIGIRMASVILRAKGFRVLTTGADTPTEDLARLVRTSRAQLLVLSGVMFATQPRTRLAEILLGLEGDAVRIIVGGSAFAAVNPLPARVEFASSMRDFDRLLGDVPPPKA